MKVELQQENPPLVETTEETPLPKKRGRPRKNPELGIGSSGSGKDLVLIRETLASLFMLVSMGVGYVNAIDGQIILEKSGSVIDAMVNVAKRNVEVRKMLLRLSKTGAYTELVAAFSMLAIPIAANHGLLPPIAIFAAGLSNELTDAIIKQKSEV